MDEPRLVRWALDPLTKARDDFPMEVVYLRRWREAMGGAEQVHDAWFLENEPGRYPLLEAYGTGLYPSERDVRVMTSVVAWFGTPLGRFFREECDALATALGNGGHWAADDAYVACWAIRNNPERREHTRFLVMGEEAATVHDLLVMESTLAWLGGERGQAFLRGCEAEVDADLKARREERRDERARRVAERAVVEARLKA